MSWTREDLAKRSDDQVNQIGMRVLNRVAKWRSVFAGWQLGTRLDADPTCQAVRDHREQSLISRVEITAITALLIEKGIITARELTEQVIIEAEHMEKLLEKKFPGIADGSYVNSPRGTASAVQSSHRPARWPYTLTAHSHLHRKTRACASRPHRGAQFVVAATDDGISYDIQVAAKTMEGWLP